MFYNKHFSNFLGICSVLPALAIMPAEAATNPIDEALTTSNPYTGTITLTEDITQAKGHEVKTGSDLTIDFANHKYNLFGDMAGSTNTETQGFQLLKGSTVAFKNGTVTVDESYVNVHSGTRPVNVINNYSNLELDNMILDGTNLAVGYYKKSGKLYLGPAYTFVSENGTSTITNSKIISKAEEIAAPGEDRTSDASWIGGDSLAVYGIDGENTKNGAMMIAQYITNGYDSVEVTMNGSEVIGNIDIRTEPATAPLGTDFDKVVLNLSGTNKITGDIRNDGTLNIAGNLELDGKIYKFSEDGKGVVNFADNSTLKANLDGSTIVDADNVTGTTSLVLDNGSDGKTFKINGTTTNSLTFAGNALFGITSTGDTEKTWTITKKSAAEQTANLEKAGLDSTAAKTVAAISGVKTMGNEQVDALFTDLTIAAQAGDADAIAQINEVAKAINPESESVVQSVAVSTQNTINNLTAGRMALGHNGGDVDLTAGGVWVQGLYNKSKNADKFSANTRGISAGIDGTINNDIMVGIGYAFGHSDVNAQTRDTDIDSHSVFLYGQYKPSEWYANATLNYTTSKYEENGISIVPVDSEYRANTFGANVATGYDFASGITPELGLRYMHVRTNAYTNSLGMDVDANSTDFLTGMIGARYGFDIIAGDAFLIRPELSAAAKYDMLSDENTATVALPGVNAYTLDGERLNRFGGEFGAGLTMSYYGFDLSLTYSIDVRKDYTSQTGMAKFRYNF